MLTFFGCLHYDSCQLRHHVDIEQKQVDGNQFLSKVMAVDTERRFPPLIRHFQECCIYKKLRIEIQKF